MEQKDRICPDSVSERIQQKRFAFGKIWTQSRLNQQETDNENILQIMPVPQDTVQTPFRQHMTDIVMIFIRYKAKPGL